VATSTAVAFTPWTLSTVNHSSLPPARQDTDVPPMSGVNTTAAAEPLVGDEKFSTTTSPALNPGVSGGGLKAAADTRPGQHALAPALLSSRGAHGVQVVTDVAAATSLNVPGAHATHAAADTVPRSSE
jgi:hypothetical protein